MDNKKWKEAEKWENCANDDFKAMYNYYIKKKGLDWCLTSDFVGFEGKVREQNYRSHMETLKFLKLENINLVHSPWGFMHYLDLYKLPFLF